jgi:hypothetical protein
MLSATLVITIGLIADGSDPVRSIADEYLLGYARMESYAARLYGTVLSPARHHVLGIVMPALRRPLLAAVNSDKIGTGQQDQSGSAAERSGPRQEARRCA